MYVPKALNTNGYMLYKVLIDGEWVYGTKKELADRLGYKLSTINVIAFTGSIFGKYEIRPVDYYFLAENGDKVIKTKTSYEMASILGFDQAWVNRCIVLKRELEGYKLSVHWEEEYEQSLHAKGQSHRLH